MRGYGDVALAFLQADGVGQPPAGEQADFDVRIEGADRFAHGPHAHIPDAGRGAGQDFHMFRRRRGRRQEEQGRCKGRGAQKDVFHDDS